MKIKFYFTLIIKLKFGIYALKIIWLLLWYVNDKEKCSKQVVNAYIRASGIAIVFFNKFNLEILSTSGRLEDGVHTAHMSLTAWGFAIIKCIQKQNNPEHEY